MRRKLICIMLIAAILLSSCGGTGESIVQSSSTAPDVTAPPKPEGELPEEKGQLIKGFSLDKIGYRCEAPPDIEIKKDIFLDRWSSTGENYSEQRVDELLGEDTYMLISVYFYGPHSLGSEPLSFICLQAFPTTDVNEKNYIEISENSYRFKDLQSCLLLKTDDICVYDVYALTSHEDLQTQITEQVDIHNGLVDQCVNATAEEREKYSIIMTEEDYVTYEDYNYLQDIAAYYTTNIGELIVRK